MVTEVGWLAKNVLGKVAPWLWSRLRYWFVGRKFKQIFGPGSEQPGFTLVCAELALAPDLSGRQYSYVKPGGNPRAQFSISRPVSLCEVRAAGYLASAIGNGVGRTPDLRSDIDVLPLLNLNFVSFGGPESNLKSRDCQSNAGNRLTRFDQQLPPQFLDLTTNAPMAEFSDPSFDYGLILKVRPSQFPERVWLMCAGFGEWGTSGAAWYLANKWEEIRKQAKELPFALVLRVRPQQDQSAEQIAIKLGEK